MTVIDLFPQEALALLRGAEWDPQATRQFDLMSESVRWSDEWLDRVVPVCRARESWAFRYLLGYRGTLIRGSPDESLSRPWVQLMEECPGWPGFRPERNSGDLWPELRREIRRGCVEFRRLLDENP